MVQEEADPRIVALEGRVKDLEDQEKLRALGLVGGEAGDLQAQLTQQRAVLGRLIGDATLGNVLLGPFPGAASSQSIRFADPIGAATPTDYKAGSLTTQQAETIFSFPEDVLRAVPFYVPGKPNLVDRISLKVNTAYPVGAKARLGIYADDGNVKPTHLLLDAGEVAIDATGTPLTTIAIKESYPRGLLWLAAVVSVAPAGGFIVSTDATTTGVWAILGEQAGTLLAGWRANHTYGALPIAFGAGGSFTATTTVVAMWLSFLEGGWS